MVEIFKPFAVGFLVFKRNRYLVILFTFGHYHEIEETATHQPTFFIDLSNLLD